MRHLSDLSFHPTGEQPPVVDKGPPQGLSLECFAGPVHVEWDTDASLTPLGQLPFFIDFLKAAGLFDAFVADCPLRYVSPNAPKKRNVLGTAMLSMLSGHKRYAHIAALRCDGVLPELLGMNKIVSEDAVRRAFAAIDENEGAVWLRRHLDYCTAPLLAEPWILDIDTTVKPLYGHQEGAVVGYNPKKPGRPSHCYHTYSMAGTRLVFDVDVVAGNEHTSKHFAPGLWALLDRVSRDLWPALLRGDCGFGNEPIMREAERRGLAYLFKLRLTAIAGDLSQQRDRNVTRMIERLSGQSAWTNAGQGWQAKESLLRLDGWSRQRRVIVLRRRMKGTLAMHANEMKAQQTLSFIEVGDFDLAVATDRQRRRGLRIFRSRHFARRGAREFRPALSRSRRQRECFRRVEEPMGMGRFRNSRPCSLPTRRTPRRAVLRLVEHLRSSDRAEPAYGGHNQSAIALACHRHAGAACETNNHQSDEFTCRGNSRGEGVSRCRHFSTRAHKKCGAVD
jgi:hypothetical protein